MDTALNVRVPADVAERLDEVAASEMRSRSGAVRVLLVEALRSRIAQAEQADHEETSDE